MRSFCKIVFIVSVLIVSTAFPASCESRFNTRFSVPSKLRPRVDFWKDVFTRYGKHQILVHHRNFPQITFDVVDLGLEGRFLNDSQFERMKKLRVERAVQKVKTALRSLAEGNPARTTIERVVASQMRKHPGFSTRRYREVLADDLIRTQTGIKEKYQLAVERSGKYLPKMESVFVHYGLPTELTRLPFIESSFNYKAYSSVGAAGIWQFMRTTARSYMKINYVVDERRDPLIATQGAAKYLKSAYKRLGSWPLAVTSYNHGVAGVARKVKAAGTSDLARIIEDPNERYFGFASTNFYPEFLAAVEIYRDWQRYFPNAKIVPLARYVERKLPKRMSIGGVARYYGVSLDDLKRVNYAFSSTVWNGRQGIPAGYTVKIPTEKQVPFDPSKLPSFSVVYDSPVVHIVRRGENLSTIARKFGTSVSSIRSLNRIRGSTIRVGQRLKVPKGKGSRSVSAPPVSTYRVKRGDTLSGIASKFGTSLNTLRNLNGLRGSVIRVGQVLRVRGTPKRTGPTYYTVKGGDSLWKISKRFKTTTGTLKKLNNLRGSVVKAGQRLRVR